MATFDLNLYNVIINPSKNYGLKSFLKLTEERKEDTKLKLLQSNVKNLMSAFESDTHKFEWSTLVNVVPSNGTGQHNKSVVKNFSEVTVEIVKKQARTTWGDCAAAYGNNFPQIMNITAINPAQTPAHLPFSIVESNRRWFPKE